eukprot:TRINITY_DN14708_c0_g1_i1.p1 TRINITY_DN14708_c0_g1~~TRINITY_DN14708_c0_g1_i1.p1  ORF type:complete len:667 (-),score=99.01 TRINITY_DN14708_c0_g1_i1:47-2047(-)
MSAAAKRGRPLNILAAKKKLNELFITWMTLPETQEFIRPLLPPDVRALGPVGLGAEPQLLSDADTLQLTHSPVLTPGGVKVPVKISPLDFTHSKRQGGPPQTLQSPPRSPKGLRTSPPSSPHSPATNLKAVDELDSAIRKQAQGIQATTFPGFKPTSPATNASQSFPTQVHAEAGPFPPHHTQPAHFPPAAVTQVAPKQPAPQPQPPPSQPPPGTRPPSPPQSRPPTAALIPAFFFPKGKPAAQDVLEREQRAIAALFKPPPPKAKPGKGAKPIVPTLRNLKARTPEWQECTNKVCGFPCWWSNQLFLRLEAFNRAPLTDVSHKLFRDWWDKEMVGKSREHRMFDFLKNNPSRDYIVKSDLVPFINDLLLGHPGLEFLKQTPEFQEKYAETVNVRIFYTVNRKGDGRLTFREFTHSTLIDTLFILDTEDDINNILEYFSYEHFYVLYCKFWELDTDHDFVLSRDDLAKYGNYCLTGTAIDAIARGIPRPLSSGVQGKINYEDFIWFCLSEEDKTSETSLEYWFKCIDIDRDGILSGYELEFFFSEQRRRMEGVLTEQIHFEDILCQMVDMINPKDPKNLRLSDIKACPTSGVFFNALFNLTKFIAFEQRDPFLVHAEKQQGRRTDWDRFARLEYDRMALEAEQSEEASEEHPSGGSLHALGVEWPM